MRTSSILELADVLEGGLCINAGAPGSPPRGHSSSLAALIRPHTSCATCISVDSFWNLTSSPFLIRRVRRTVKIKSSELLIPRGHAVRTASLNRLLRALWGPRPPLFNLLLSSSFHHFTFCWRLLEEKEEYQFVFEVLLWWLEDLNNIVAALHGPSSRIFFFILCDILCENDLYI